MRSPLVAIVLLACAPLCRPQQQAPPVRTTPLAAGLYLLEGQGGNLAVAIGDQGVLLVDAQYAPLVPAIRAAVARLTEGAIRLVVNTHWHFDHVGGNELLATGGAVILAHENVRRRMSTEQLMLPMNRRIPPSPPAALPVVTIRDEATVHWGDHELELFHVPHAHTDGDVIVRFAEANVVHLGDVFFHGSYPFLDVSSGGSLDGLIAAVARVLERCDDETKIIPGHGALTDKAGLARYHAMLRQARDRVADLVVKGATADEVVAARPTQEWDAELGQGFIDPQRFARTLYGEVVRGLGLAGEGRGQVHVRGSDLLLELAERWVAATGGEPQDVPQVHAAGGGSGGGVMALIAGETDVAFVSRLPGERELAAMRQREITVRTVEFAREALAIVVRTDNPIATLDTTQLAGIFGAGRQLTAWSRLGVTMPATGDAITPFAPQADSGEAEHFARAVLGPAREYGAGVMRLGGSRDLVTAVAQTPGAIAFVRLAHAEAEPGVRVVPIARAGAAGLARMPDHADYPLQRSCYLLLRTDASAAARAFVDWVRSAPGRELTRAAGFVPVGAPR